MDDAWRAQRARFAECTAEIGRRTGLLTDPTFDAARFRLHDGTTAIDLYNPWHLLGCPTEPDERALAPMLAPGELGEAGYLGRVDVVRRMLAAGADPNAPEPDGMSPIRRTLAAWVTTDLHVETVTALLDGGLVVYAAEIASLMAETTGKPVDRAIARILTERATPGEPPAPVSPPRGLPRRTPRFVPRP